jgi:acyl-CoA synthetase (AMP-forming)/AMP-acid ligase II
MSDGDPSAAGRLTSAARQSLRTVRAASRAGLLAPIRPDRVARMAAAPVRLGTGVATLVALAAARHPDQPALIDELGTITYGELDHRAGAIAAALRDDFGVRRGRAVAVMCRNHRGFIEAAAAVSRCGADLLLVNTELPGPQLAQIVDRARPVVAVYDEEFADRFDRAAFAGSSVTGWHDEPLARPTLDSLASRLASRIPATRQQGKLVLLTSGTTGAPKSAPRNLKDQAVLEPATTFLTEVPLKAREPMLIGPPLFHGFGFSFLALGLALGSTIVMRRRFDAEAMLEALDEHHVTTLIAVPVMLRRVLEVALDRRRPGRARSLRIVLSAAAPLDATLSNGFMDTFGDLLYNVYGTTETGLGSIATPADLRAAPGTVGRPLGGTVVKILDDDRAVLESGEAGHVFIGGDLVFEGYANGATKETLGELMNTGDLGHFDGEGRLFIDGREDDMIVSGGENVFPREVEDVLRRHEHVRDVYVIGVEDEEFGQRLRAFVVSGTGADVSERELTDHVRASLERYKVPREIVFLDELPRNATGKVLRTQLASPA